jgi:hypothetical protein
MNHRLTKACAHCGDLFSRRKRVADSQWAKAAFCTPVCRNKSRATHRRTRTRLYKIWVAIKQRCLNPRAQSFPDYGARGIALCEDWRDDFVAFANYVEPDPGVGFELGRLNNDLGYQPGNVRWETRRQNNCNRRDTHWVKYKGRRLSLAEACEEAGLRYSLVEWRLRHGWDAESALKPRSVGIRAEIKNDPVWRAKFAAAVSAGMAKARVRDIDDARRELAALGIETREAEGAASVL